MASIGIRTHDQVSCLRARGRCGQCYMLFHTVAPEPGLEHTGTAREVSLWGCGETVHYLAHCIRPG
jgi:hypothetical protein